MTYANCPECGFVAFHPTKTGYCGFVCERKAKDASIEKLTAQLAAAEKVVEAADSIREYAATLSHAQRAVEKYDAARAACPPKTESEA